MAEIDAIEKTRCPNCGGLDTRHSYPRGLMDSFMHMFGRRPYRCRNCRKRFYDVNDVPERESVEAG